MIRIPFVLALVATAILAVVGCGDEGGAAPDDLADLLPADAALYYEQTLLPTDEQKESIESIAAKFPDGEDLGSMLEMALDDSTDQGFSFSEDIKPWLGSRVVAASSELGPGELPGAAVAEITDADLAEEKLGELAAGEGEISEEDYEGETYSLGTDGDGGMLAYAVRDDFLLASNTSEGIEALLDVEAGRNDSLADTDAGTELVEAVEVVGGEQPLQAAAVTSESLVDLFAGNVGAIELPPEQMDLLREQLEDANLDGAISYGIGLTENDSAAIDISFPSSGGVYSGESSELLAELPADSFFALAAAGLDGEAFAAGFEFGFRQSGGTEISPETLEAELGFDILELVGTVTEYSVFALGTDMESLGGALVVGIDDSEPSLEAIEGARDALDADLTVETDDLPGELADFGEGFAVRTPAGPPINVVVSDDQLVIGVGDEATVRAFEPEEPLGEEQISAAEEALGEGFSPSLILDSPKALELAQALGAGTDPGFEEALPYLEPLGILAAGSKQEDGRAIGRLALSFEE